MSVDNIREAVKAVLDGGKLGEVAGQYGVDKGALSKLVTGARIGLELAETTNVDNGQDCDSCERVQDLTAQVEALTTATVDNTHAGDTTDPPAELARLKQEIEDLRTAADTMAKLAAADLTPKQLRSVIDFCAANEVDLVDIVRRWLTWAAAIRTEREKYKRLQDKYDVLKFARKLASHEIKSKSETEQ